MSKIMNSAALALGAAAVAIVSLASFASPSAAAPKGGKNYCERVCYSDGTCFQSCAEVQRRAKLKRPPTTRPQPEPVPLVAEWREKALFSSAGGGGGGGGGGNR